VTLIQTRRVGRGLFDGSWQPPFQGALAVSTLLPMTVAYTPMPFWDHALKICYDVFLSRFADAHFIGEPVGILSRDPSARSTPSHIPPAF